MCKVQKESEKSEALCFPTCRRDAWQLQGSKGDSFFIFVEFLICLWVFDKES